MNDAKGPVTAWMDLVASGNVAALRAAFSREGFPVLPEQVLEVLLQRAVRGRVPGMVRFVAGEMRHGPVFISGRENLLSHLMKAGDHEILKVLVETGFVAVPDVETASALLSDAVKKRSPEMVSTLLSLGGWFDIATRLPGFFEEAVHARETRLLGILDSRGDLPNRGAKTSSGISKAVREALEGSDQAFVAFCQGAGMADLPDLLRCGDCGSFFLSPGDSRSLAGAEIRSCVSCGGTTGDCCARLLGIENRRPFFLCRQCRWLLHQERAFPEGFLPELDRVRRSNGGFLPGLICPSCGQYCFPGQVLSEWTLCPDGPHLVCSDCLPTGSVADGGGKSLCMGCSSEAEAYRLVPSYPDGRFSFPRDASFHYESLAGVVLDPEALLHEGKKLESQGDPASLARAVELYERAAGEGNVEARFRLASHLWDGKGVLPDRNRAADLFRIGAESGHPDSQYMMGVVLSSGEDGRQDGPNALRWFRLAAAKGDPRGAFSAALMLEDQDPAEHSEEILRLLDGAAAKNFPPAIHLLGFKYAYGRGVGRNEAEALKLIRRAAELGFPPAMTDLGNLHRQGTGVPRDDAEAVRLFKSAAGLGDVRAMYFLGVHHLEGRGVPKNPRKGVEWLKNSAEKGAIAAQHLLGKLNESGEGMPQNFVAARKWHSQAAKQGYAPAKHDLGCLLSEGRGGPPDPAGAFQLFQEAAELEYVPSYLRLWNCHFNGKGTPVNQQAALKWGKAAAEADVPEAFLPVGVMFLRGQGTKVNLLEAARWIRKAADNNDSRAQFQLGKMFEMGWGVPKDRAEALAWMGAALAGAEPGARKAEIQRAISVLEKQLNPDEIGRAEKLAVQKLARKTP